MTRANVRQSRYAMADHGTVSVRSDLMTLPTTPDDADLDQRAGRLRALEIAARVHGFVADLIDDRYVRIHTTQRPSLVINVRCALRGDDGGRAWFAEQDRWLAQADDITGALVALKGLTAGR